MERTLSPQQVALMLFIFITGSVSVYLPELPAQHSAWMACLLGSLVGLYILIALLAIFDRFPGMNITQISDLLLGRVGSTLLNILLFSSLFLIAQGLLYNMILLLRNFYPAVGPFAIRSLLIFAAAFFVYRGPAMLGRLSEAFIFLILLIFLLGMAAATPLMDLSQLKPLWPEWKSLFSGSFFVAEWPFAQLLILAFFFPLVQKWEGKKKLLWGWFLLAVVVIVIQDLHVVSILGRDFADIARFPLLKVTRVIALGEFQRVELFLFVLWFVIGFAAIAIYYQGMILNLQQFLRLKNSRPLIIPLGLLLIVSSALMYPSDLNYMATRLRYAPFYILSINLLYPSIILVAAVLSKK